MLSVEEQEFLKTCTFKP